MTGSENAFSDNNAIAVIGMAGRFPGAETIASFWQNLRKGVESVTFFDTEQLVKSGIEPAVIQQSNYVRAKPVLNNVDYFDAPFFRISPREAELMDPQQRLFLECGWEAIEDCAHDPWTHPGRIGIYAAAGKNTYLLLNLLSQREWVHSDEVFQLLIGNEKDYLTSRLAYQLNLTGPSITVQSACSSSLVAVHLACQSLLLGECDIALAGGVSVDVPREAGYLYRPGSILSPDGHCRAFDAEAQGTIFGQGLGLVVLRRVTDAIADRDCIRAVILGSAVNNDGALRTGFTAPTVNGQAQAIAEAIAVSGVHPETITYVEAHGTATPIGDPIEIQGLTKAYRAYTKKNQYCAIGSLKTNVGHLGAAAGIASLMKTILAVEHAEIPPSLHFRVPNPQIDFATTPFFVNTEPRKWKTDGSPRRAGVSSFGQGGTNAHIILEQAPSRSATVNPSVWQVLLISAHNSTARDEATKRMCDALRETRFDLADIAYTLQVGRKHFSCRRAIVCDTTEHAVRALEALDPQFVADGEVDLGASPVTFLLPDVPPEEFVFPSRTYESEALFRSGIDECRPFLSVDSNRQIDSWLTDSQALINNANSCSRAELVPILFAVQYSLARLLKSRGITPTSVLGNGAGEFVAATLSGRLTLQDALSAAGESLPPSVRDVEIPPDSVVQLEIAPRRGFVFPYQVTNRPSISGGEAFAHIMGSLWTSGVSCDWHAYHGADHPSRVPLPTYPFQRQRYWVAARADAGFRNSAQVHIERETCDQPARSGSSSVAFVAPRSDVETAIAAAFGAALGIQHIGVNDDFFELGGHSLLEPRIRINLQSSLGFDLPLGALFDYPTIAKLANLVDQSPEHAIAGRHGSMDANADVTLDSEISASDRRYVLSPDLAPLITGSTGFLGSHILDQLLLLTDGPVYCLVRAKTEEQGKQKIRQALECYGVGRDQLLDRVKPVLGDLCEGKLGLSDAEFDRLAHRIGSIYHSGARVNFVQPYRSLRQTNVAGTHEVLRLAATGPVKAVHHISSVAVFESDTFATVTEVGENEDIAKSEGFHNGYDLSKWVSERVIALARDRCIPISVYRLSNIAGDSATGVTLPQHIIACLIKGCIQLGLAPGEDKIVNVLPVDIASSVIVKLSLCLGALRSNFHIVNPVSTRVKDIIKWLTEAGYKLSLCSYEDWRNAIRCAPSTNVLKPFLLLLDQGPLFTNRSYDCLNTQSWLPGNQLECPPFDKNLLSKYLRHLVRQGYLEEPRYANSGHEHAGISSEPL